MLSRFKAAARSLISTIIRPRADLALENLALRQQLAVALAEPVRGAPDPGHTPRLPQPRHRAERAPYRAKRLADAPARRSGVLQPQ
jgi:hypothetical protein